MRLLEVYTPKLEANIKYKVLDFDDVDGLVEEAHIIPPNVYKSMIIETCIYNLKTEITPLLRSMDRKEADEILQSIYNGCIMLNPGLDPNRWLQISGTDGYSDDDDSDDDILETAEVKKTAKQKAKGHPAGSAMTRSKFMGLESHLKDRIVGQDEAIDTVVKSLKRSVAKLTDPERPISVFLFAGGSGTGKTQLAKELHKYVFGDHDMVRIDCGEYQRKHENQKLIGSPPGYVGSEDGGHFTNQIAKNPNSVVLIDEVEKANPDVWNTFLRIFDEGLITDGKGEIHSFRESIIIMTSNLGNREVLDSITEASAGFAARLGGDATTIRQLPSRDSVRTNVTKKIQKTFKPEFLNRIDKMVVFNYLTKDNLDRIADLELQKVGEKLRNQGYQIDYPEAVTDKIVDIGTSPSEGARGLSRVCRDQIEDLIADALVSPSRKPARGSMVYLYVEEDEFKVEIRRPNRKKKAQKNAVQ